MEPQKTIKELSEIELKALAYDQISVSEQAQHNLKLINEELHSRNLPPQPFAPDEDKVPTPYFDALDPEADKEGGVLVKK